MKINITDEIISLFFSGTIVVLALIAVGAFLMFLLKGMGRKAPFLRITLVLALTPLSLINFLGRSESTALLYFAMATTLLGFLIEGINHLLQPKERPQPRQEPVLQFEQKKEEEEKPAESSPGVIVWEKAE